METEKHENDDISKLGTILRENWEHARYCEYEMLWFTNIYAAIVAGALVFMSRIYYTQTPRVALALLISIFLLIFSVLGFRVVIALSLGHQSYIINVLMILDYWNKTGFYKDPKKPFFFKRSYRNFYEVTIALFTALSLFYALQICAPGMSIYGYLALSIAMLIIVFLFIEKVLYRCCWRKYSEKRYLLIKALRKSKGGFYRHNWDDQLENEDSDLWKKIGQKPESTRSLLRCRIFSWICTETRNNKNDQDGTTKSDPT